MSTLVALLLALGGVLLSGAPALASCAAPTGTLPEQLAEAEAVFVGTVLATPGDDRLAEVVVEAVWRGDVAESVVVRGSEMAGDPNGATSVDRSYRAGERYLFAVRGSGARFTDDICTPTRVWDADLNRHRPEGAPMVVGPVVGRPAGDAPMADPTAADAPAAEAAGDGTDRAGSPSVRIWLLVGLTTVGAVAWRLRRSAAR